MSKCSSLPPATKLGQGYVFTGVCHSVNRGEYLTRYTPPGPGTPPRTRYTPPDQVHPPRTRYTPLGQVPPRTRYTPPGPGTPPQTRYTPLTRCTHPPDQVHPPQARYPPGTRYTPPVQSMLGDTVNTWVVRILLECNLVHVLSCFSCKCSVDK